MRLAFVVLIGCSGTNAQPAAPPEPVGKPIVDAAANAQREALAAQLAEGKRLFGEQCASCHGDTALGTDDAPALVGKDVFPRYPRDGSKRTAEFHTAADVFAFAVKNMPANEPGTLTTEQYLAVFAYVLKADGVVLLRPLPETALPSIVLHP